VTSAESSIIRQDTWASWDRGTPPHHVAPFDGVAQERLMMWRLGHQISGRPRSLIAERDQPDQMPGIAQNWGEFNRQMELRYTMTTSCVATNAVATARCSPAFAWRATFAHCSTASRSELM
jgi:hypothetical protein